MSEHQIQSAFFEILGFTTLSEYAFAIPNGGKRNITTALRLKKEGVRPGVFDVFFSMSSNSYSGFYIEFKMPGGKLTDHQIEFAIRMTNAGYLCNVYTDAMQTYEAVKAYTHNYKMDSTQWQQHIRKKRVKQQAIERPYNPAGA